MSEAKKRIAVIPGDGVGKEVIPYADYKFNGSPDLP
jgi:isocitrate/isopropylmalate dehydrogenase